MEFINEASQTSQNEPRKKQLLKREQAFLRIEDFHYSIIDENEESQFKSEDDDLALFGVGGPA